MFCNKCGNQLEDNAKFCDKCGNAVGGATEQVKVEKVPDTEIQLEVKPQFKILYFMWGKFAFALIVLIMAIIFGVATNELAVAIVVALIFDAFVLIIPFISVLFKKKQLECMRYDFYKTKVSYSDSFLNKAEKEVKYKHIRECVHIRTIGDRIFGFGRIILYTNAETGFGNGIMIPCLTNSEEVYKKIKELIDQD